MSSNKPSSSTIKKLRSDVKSWDRFILDLSHLTPLSPVQHTIITALVHTSRRLHEVLITMARQSVTEEVRTAGVSNQPGDAKTDWDVLKL